MKLFRFLVLGQSLYYFVTAVWPIVSIESFMLVTGPKTDLWLVKTVGALLIPISLTLASYLFIKTDKRPAVVLGATSTIAFASVDFYYALSDVVSDIYLLDGVVQGMLFVLWAIVVIRYGREWKMA